MYNADFVILTFIYNLLQSVKLHVLVAPTKIMIIEAVYLALLLAVIVA